MRRWPIALAALVAIALAADFGLRLFADQWAEQELGRALSLRERPSVSIGGFPFLPQLLSGDITHVSAHADGPFGDPLPVRNVDLVLEDVSFSTRRLIEGRHTMIHVGNGHGTAHVDEGDLNAALEALAPVTVRFRDETILVRSTPFDQEFEATPLISSGNLVLATVGGSLPELSVELPGILEGVEYQHVRIQGTTAELSFTISGASFGIDRS
jgi:hypothetical protein